MRGWAMGIVLTLTACGGAAAPAGLSPEQQLAHGRALVRRGQFGKALPFFQRLSFEFGPSQPEYAEVRYWVGESHFQLRDYAQAIQEFRRAADGSPESPWAPLALLRLGDANLRLWKRPELDPTSGEEALAVYQELGGRYPGTEAAARAALHVRRLKEQFAEKAYKTGLFYQRRRAYDSAILYFKEVIAGYPEASRAADALLRLVDVYRVIGYAEERQETCDHLRRYYPRASGLADRCPPAAGPS